MNRELETWNERTIVNEEGMPKSGRGLHSKKRATPRLRWAGVVPLLASLLSACWGTASKVTPETDESAILGSGSAPAAPSGGAGSLGSGGTSVVAGSGGTGGASVGSGGRMTEAEWRAATAPLSGPHEIWTYDECDPPHAGSSSVRVGQEYSVVPPVGYTAAADFDAETNVVFDVSLGSYCVSSADCTEQPDGVCQGRIVDAYCQYPDPLPPDECSTDADCTKKPDGTCVAPIGFEEHRLCYPTGVCKDPSGTCVYAGDAPCTDDADCTEGADGRCIFPVVSTNCRYGTCFEDTDCEDGQRCGCGQCVEADCTSDDVCPEGETCEMSRGFCFGYGGFYCSTPNDRCKAGESGCIYQPDGVWGSGICTK